jgi:PPOX class probable F420-dependent enzyme
VSPDGSPHATITWVDAADGHVLVNTAEGRVKHRNCAANPRVAITVMKNGDAYDWISITGTVVAFETGEHAERHIDELSHRYDRHGYNYTPGQVREILKIRPRRIIRYKD